MREGQNVPTREKWQVNRKNPRFGQFCCNNGKISLPEPKPVPDLLRYYLTQDDPLCKHFRQYIRVYNSAMAFASLGSTAVKHKGRGPPLLLSMALCITRSAPSSKPTQDTSPSTHKSTFLTQSYNSTQDWHREITTTVTAIERAAID